MRLILQYLWIVCTLMMLISLTSGCQQVTQTNPPFIGGVAQVPIRVFRVIGPLDTTAQGAMGANFGCRLDDTDINNVVTAFVQNAFALYDSTARFTPIVNFDSRIILDVRVPASFYGNPNPPPNTRTKRDDNFKIILLTYWPDSYPEWYGPADINVYFMGNIQLPPIVSPPGQNNGILAITFDPAEYYMPFVTLNDGGFDLQFGLAAGSSFLRTDHVLEHEITHYLGRFNNRLFQWSAAAGPNTFPLVSRSYNGGEHALRSSVLDPLPGPIKDILAIDARPHQLYVPGANASGPQGPRAEIINRLQLGNWNVP